MKTIYFFIYLCLTTFSVFGQLSFENSYPLENDFGVSNLAAADFDGDTFKDIVYANTTEMKIVIMHNLGSPDTSFTQTITVNNAPGTLSSLKLGDINNDGKVDMITIYSNKNNYEQSQLIILLSNGSTFSQQNIDLPLSWNLWLPQIIDFDKDGNLDVLISSNDMPMYLYKGDGKGIFSSSIVTGIPQISSLSNSILYKSSDIDLDGDNDFVIVSLDTVFVYLKNDQGYSVAKYSSIEPFQSYNLAIGDVSGDGYPDLILGKYLTNSQTLNISEYINDGLGGLGDPISISTKSFYTQCNIDLLDYNKDGRLDILTGSNTGGFGQDFILLQNMGNNQFSDQAPQCYYTAVFTSTIFADLDDDGTAEILELSLFKFINLFHQVSGTYQFSKRIVLGTTAETGDVIDINNDGNKDIVTTSEIGGTLSIFYGAGNRNFNKPIYFTSNDDGIYAVTTSDFNGDGFQDVIYATTNGAIIPTIAIILSDQSGVLNQSQIIDQASSSALASGDFNSDGKTDIVTDHGIYINDGSAHFTLNYFSNGTPSIIWIYTGDFNADNFLDLLVSDGGTIYIGLNDGQGNFAFFNKVISENVLSTKTTLINSDNLTDIITVRSDPNYNQVISIFINQGDGTFAEQKINGESNSYFSEGIDIDDLNYDGLKDIVVGFSNNNLWGVQILLQDVNGNYNPYQNVGFKNGLTGVSAPDFVKIVDIDNDSKKDIVCFKQNGDPIEIIFNDYVFEPTQSPQSLKLTSLTNQTATFSMKKGNGNGRLAVIRESSSKRTTPIDSIFYASNSRWGIGAQIGNQNYVVLRSDTTAFNVSGLSDGTNYTLTVYEYNTNSANTIINYLALASDSINFTTMKSQEISIHTIADKTQTDQPFILNASSSSGLSVSYTLLSGQVILSGDTVKIISPGPVEISVDQVGDSLYLPANTKEIDFCVNPSVPTITITDLSPRKYILTSSSSSNNQWFLNGQPIADATQSTYEPTDNGTYTVKVDYSGCSAVSNPAGIVTAIEPIPSLKGYPNPVYESFMVNLPNSENAQEVMLLDLTGKNISVTYQRMNEGILVDLKMVPSGLYFVKISSQTKMYSLKVIKLEK